MDYVLIALLGLNFLGVLYIIKKISARPQSDGAQQQTEQILLQQTIKNKQEITGLKQLLLQQHQQLMEEWKQVKEAPQVQEEKPPQVVEEPLFLNDRYEEVFALKRKGLTTAEIAKKLEKGYGEIDLILQLARKEEKE